MYRVDTNLEFLHDDCVLSVQNITECKTALEKINQTCSLFATRFYRRVEDFGDYVAQFPEKYDEKDLVVKGTARRQRRALRNLGVKGKIFPWEILQKDYNRKEGLKFLLCADIDEGKKTLYFEYGPRTTICPYCEKGYHKLAESVKKLEEDISSKSFGVVSYAVQLIVNNNKKWRILRNRKISKVQKAIEKDIGPIGSTNFSYIRAALEKKPEHLEKICENTDLKKVYEDLKKLEKELEEVAGKMYKVDSKFMNVLMYKTVIPNVLIIPKYCFKARSVSGEEVDFYSRRIKPTPEEMKEKDVAELLLMDPRKHPYAQDLTEECKTEITQKLESLAVWLEEQVPLIPL